jgi:acetyl esterase/lipase
VQPEPHCRARCHIFSQIRPICGHGLAIWSYVRCRAARPVRPAKAREDDRIKHLAAAAVILAMALSSAPAAAAAPTQRAARAEALTTTTVTYARGRGEKMRVFTPKAGRRRGALVQRRPAVLFVHSGAWKRADARSAEFAEGRKIARTAGWVTAVVNYPTTIRPYRRSEPHEIHAALLALRRQRSVDPHRVAIWGESAGGHLGLLIGYRHPGQVKAVVSVSGPTDMTTAYLTALQTVLDAVRRFEGMDPSTAHARGSDRYAATSPVDTASAGSPPTFQAGSADDLLVPPSQLTELGHRLAALHVVHRTLVVPGNTHIPESATIPGTSETVFDAAIRFLRHRGL